MFTIFICFLVLEKLGIAAKVNLCDVVSSFFKLSPDMSGCVKMCHVVKMKLKGAKGPKRSQREPKGANRRQKE